MSAARELQHVSLFTGVGGLDLAAAAAGIPTLLACEVDDAARGVLHDRFPHTRLHTDVTELTADDLRAAGAEPGRTVLSAGWPCQGNSVAGARQGMDDPRSGLWSQVARLLDEFRPAWFLGENVDGLLSVNGGRDFGAVLGDLADLGYGYAWRVLDAQYFGVPQRRRRVVIVGRAGGDGAAPVEVLLEPEGGPRHPAPGGGARPGPARATQGRVAATLAAVTAHYGKGADSDATDPMIVDPLAGEGVRRLTPLECERLQGWPDQHTATSWGARQADSPRYRQMGNGVAAPVFQWVLQRLAAVDAAAPVRADLRDVLATAGRAGRAAGEAVPPRRWVADDIFAGLA